MKGYEYVQLEYVYPLIKILSVIMLVFLIVSCDRSTDYGSSRISQAQSRFIPKVCEDKCYIKVEY